MVCHCHHHILLFQLLTHLHIFPNRKNYPISNLVYCIQNMPLLNILCMLPDKYIHIHSSHQNLYHFHHHITHYLPPPYHHIMFHKILKVINANHYLHIIYNNHINNSNIPIGRSICIQNNHHTLLNFNHHIIHFPQSNHLHILEYIFILSIQIHFNKINKCQIYNIYKMDHTKIYINNIHHIQLYFNHHNLPLLKQFHHHKLLYNYHFPLNNNHQNIWHIIHLYKLSIFHHNLFCTKNNHQMLLSYYLHILQFLSNSYLHILLNIDFSSNNILIHSYSILQISNPHNN